MRIFTEPKTVRIPVRVQGNRLTFFYGGAFPNIKWDALAELTIPADSVEDPELLNKLTCEEDIEFIPAGTTLLVQLRRRLLGSIDADMTRYLELTAKRQISAQQSADLAAEYPDSAWAEIVLNTPLELRLRGSKAPQLGRCQCMIPFLERAAGTVNQAYTLLSEAFERKRVSRGGNCFRQVFSQDADEYWRPLDVARRRAVMAWEMRSWPAQLELKMPSRRRG